MIYFLIFVMGLFSGAFGAITGGVSILTIPALIWLGLPAPVAIATNRLGLAGMSLFGWYAFHVKKQIDYRVGFIVGIPAMFGAIIGANLVLQIEKDLLERIIGILSLLILLVFLFSPTSGMQSVAKKLTRRHYLLGAILSFFWGIYGGFYGAAYATVLNALLIFLFGQTFLQSAATHKIAMVLLSLMATAIFAYHGAIHYPYGLTLFAGMSAGSYFASRYAEKIGNLWIRRSVLALGAVMAAMLLF